MREKEKMQKRMSNRRDLTNSSRDAAPRDGHALLRRGEKREGEEWRDKMIWEKQAGKIPEVVTWVTSKLRTSLQKG